MSSERLPTPTADPTDLFSLGWYGVPFPQYVFWADQATLFAQMAEAPVHPEELVARTRLNERGVDALLGVLTALGVTRRGADGRYRLSDAARQYLLPTSPFYVADQLYVTMAGPLDAPLPAAFVDAGEAVMASAGETKAGSAQLLNKDAQFGGAARLRNQHARNFPAAVVAARSGRFDGIRHLVDIGGGTGVFEIPLALTRNDIRLTIVELPAALDGIKGYLDQYGVTDRVELVGLDALKSAWTFDTCDGILLANFLHDRDDETCLTFLKQAHAKLEPRGRVFIHEMLWNDAKDGPLLTALVNFVMRSHTRGRQRTRAEWANLLTSAGFFDIESSPTTGDFTLISATATRR